MVAAKYYPEIDIPQDQAWHVARRFGGGGSKLLADEIRAVGPARWMSSQLDGSVDDSKAEGITKDCFPLMFVDGRSLEPYFPNYMYAAQAYSGVQNYLLTRRIFSRRPVLEEMIAFLSNHLNVYLTPSIQIGLGDYHISMRKHALGSMPALYKEIFSSQSMIVYLNNNTNTKESPNENLARELLELFTLGGNSVSGVYTENDVKSIAKFLTGLGSNGMYMQYFPERHHVGEIRLEGTGLVLSNSSSDWATFKVNFDKLIDHLVLNAKGAEFLMTKLCTWFVSDNPPRPLVKDLVYQFQRSKGNMKPVLQMLVTHPYFTTSVGQKLKRPDELAVSAIRSLKPIDLAKHPSWTYQIGNRCLELTTREIKRMGFWTHDKPVPWGYSSQSADWVSITGAVNRQRTMATIFCTKVDSRNSSTNSWVNYGFFTSKADYDAWNPQLVKTSIASMAGITEGMNLYEAIDRIAGLVTNIPLSETSKSALAVLWKNPKTPGNIPVTTTTLSLSDIEEWRLLSVYSHVCGISPEVLIN